MMYDLGAGRLRLGEVGITLGASLTVGVALGVWLSRPLDERTRRARDDEKHALALSDCGQKIHRHLVDTQKPASVLGIRVERYNDGDDFRRPTLVLSAPLDGNTNVHGTAFAGSLYSVAVLYGYYVVHAWIRDDEEKRKDGKDYVLVARSGTIRYLRPVTGCDRIVAYSSLPSKDAIDGFRKELVKKGNADLDATAVIRLDDGTVACECDVRLCAYRQHVIEAKKMDG